MSSNRELEDRLGYSFADQTLLSTALTHRSAIAEGAGGESYERLEFLGDAVLDLVVAELLYETHPDLSEGEMAKTRAAVVGEPMLAEIARELGLGEVVLLGVGEERTGGRDKASILSDVVESIIGAAYREGGLDAARQLIVGLWGDRIAQRVDHPGKYDYKSRLQERLALSGERPTYTASGEGPDHARRFTAVVTVGDAELGSGSGTSKKRAEQEAARRALEALDRA